MWGMANRFRWRFRTSCPVRLCWAMCQISLNPFGTLPMPRYDHPPYMPYTETYFKWKIFFIVSRLAGKVLGGVLIVFLLIATSCFPDYSTQIILTTLGVLVGIVVLSVLWAIFSVINRVFFPPTARQRALAMDKKMGWVSNPEPGVSWFRADGSKKEYNHATGEWR